VSRLLLNGRAVEVTSNAVTPLLDVLREELGDTSPKPGCLEGRCGACTVLLDGEPVLSCLLPLGRALDGQITTVRGSTGEGDPAGHRLNEIKAAFARAGAVQCGICTPGMILATSALVSERDRPTRAEIQEGLVNNLCRCTGYAKILDAVESLAEGKQPGHG